MDLTLRSYEIVDIEGVQLTFGYWVARYDGLVAVAVDYIFDLFEITTRASHLATRSDDQAAAF